MEELGRTVGTEANLGPVGLGVEGRGCGDKPAPPCRVMSATQKVGAESPKIDEKKRCDPPSASVFFLKFRQKADL